MPKARCNGIEIEYEVLGDEQAEPMLLVMGFAVQLIAWPDGFCRMLVERGYRVIRFDNRDVGLSSKVPASYSLDDLAADTAGLRDALELASAHVVGASMGGFIAQLLAIHHPSRVRSLCSIMSSTGDRSVGQPRPEIVPMLMVSPPAERSSYVDARLAIARRLASPGFPFDEQRSRDVIGLAFDRAYYPAGAQRQLAAVLAARDRTRALGELRLPTLVIHGAEDPLVHRSGGEATARAIPGAELLVIPGMGHDLPKPLLATLADAIVANARRRLDGAAGA